MWTFSKFLVFSKGSTPKLNTSFRQAIKCASCSVVSVSLQPQGLHASSQPPLPMEFSKQDTGVGSPSSPRDLPNPGIEPGSPASQADSLPLSHRGSPMVNKKIVRSDYLSGSSPTWNWNLVPLTTFLPNIIALCFVFPISKQWPRRAERMVKARGTFKVDSTAI